LINFICEKQHNIRDNSDKLLNGCPNTFDSVEKNNKQ